MSVILKYNICPTNGCTQLKFTETTGSYSTANLTGWGSPNDEISDVVSAVLTIIGPDEISYNIDLFDTGLYPSNNTNIEYTIPSTEYGSPTSITDGQWYFLYTVTMDNDTIYTTTIYKYFYCTTQCCVNNMIPLLKDSCDCCDLSVDITNYLTAWVMLESLKKAAACGDYTAFTSIKKIIDKLCLNSGCKTCK